MPKISQFTAQTGASVANGDLFPIVDVGSPNVSEYITADELAQIPQLTSRYVPTSNDAMWLDPERFRISQFGGSPTLTNQSNTPAWLFDQTTVEEIHINVVLPNYWNTYHVDLYWTNAGAGAGDVRWACSRVRLSDGDALSEGDSSLGAQTITAPAQNVMKVSRLTSSAGAVASGDLNRILFYRNANDGADTLGNDAAMLGLRLVRAS